MPDITINCDQNDHLVGLNEGSKANKITNHHSKKKKKRRKRNNHLPNILMIAFLDCAVFVSSCIEP